MKLEKERRLPHYFATAAVIMATGVDGKLFLPDDTTHTQNVRYHIHTTSSLYLLVFSSVI